MNLSQKPSIVIITFLCPFPVSDGGRFGVFSFVNDIKEIYNVTLVFKVLFNEKENVIALNKLWPEVDIKAFYTENAIRTNAVKQKKSLYKTLIKPIRKAKYIRRAKNSSNVKSVAHSPYPFVPLEREFVDFVGNLFHEKKFDIVQIEYSDMLSLVHLIPNESKKVFFLHESRYLILDDYYRVNEDKGVYASYIVATAKFTEINLMSKYDRILVLNNKDRERLSEYIPEYKLRVIPTSVPQNLIPRCKPASKATRLVFLGSQSHHPNLDGVQWFANEMLDEVYSATGLNLFVSGTWTDAFKFQYPKLNFTGFVDDIADVIQSGILIVPIRLGGGGIRIKILQAMACGVPVVATRLVTEGVQGVVHGHNILIADTVQEFVRAIVLMANNQEVYNSISKRAKEMIANNYAANIAIEVKKNIFEELLEE